MQQEAERWNVPSREKSQNAIRRQGWKVEQISIITGSRCHARP